MLTADTMNRSMQAQSASCTGPCGHVTFAVRCPAQTAAGMQIRPGLIANQKIRCAAPLSRGPALRYVSYWTIQFRADLPADLSEFSL